MRLMLYGLGDLGERIAYQLVPQLAATDALCVASRSLSSVHEVYHMVRMLRESVGRGPELSWATWDLDHTESAIQNIERFAPNALIFTATRLTWWKVQELGRDDLLSQAGFGIWYPVHADLLLKMAKILSHLQRVPWLVVGPYPDVTAPVLKARGFDKIIGFGNVDELAMVAQIQHPTADEVRLIAHHSLESRLFANRPLPPYLLQVKEAGVWRPSTLSRPFLWPTGTRSHVWTAASAVRTVLALLGDAVQSIHVPGPNGLAGGYPCKVGRRCVELNLPPGISEERAVGVNIRAMEYDGIRAIGSDGTVAFTNVAQDALNRIFGVSWSEVPPHQVGAAADLLVDRFEASRRER